MQGQLQTCLKTRSSKGRHPASASASTLVNVCATSPVDYDKARILLSLLGVAQTVTIREQPHVVWSVTKAVLEVILLLSQKLRLQKCATTLAQNSLLNSLFYQNLHSKYIQHSLNTPGQILTSEAVIWGEDSHMLAKCSPLWSKFTSVFISTATSGLQKLF